jgi:hypothetical protein
LANVSQRRDTDQIKFLFSGIVKMGRKNKEQGFLIFEGGAADYLRCGVGQCRRHGRENEEQGSRIFDFRS